MERERLARQKRLRPDIAQDTNGAAGGEDEEETVEDTRSAKRQRVSSSTVLARTNIVSSSTRTSTPATGMSRASSGSDTGEGFYFDGELRQTANKYVEPARDNRPVFRLSDILAPVSVGSHIYNIFPDPILQRNEIAFAVVSAFVINLPWFYSLFNRETPVIVATQDPGGMFAGLYGPIYEND